MDTPLRREIRHVGRWLYTIKDPKFFSKQSRADTNLYPLVL